MSAFVIFACLQTVKRVCLRCWRIQPFQLADAMVVSPSGLAHHAGEDGYTACGRDATGPDWWWHHPAECALCDPEYDGGEAWKEKRP